MLGLWLERSGQYPGDIQSLLKTVNCWVKMYPPLATHTVLCPTTPYCLGTCNEVSGLGRGSHSMQWEHQTMKNETKQNNWSLEHREEAW